MAVSVTGLGEVSPFWKETSKTHLNKGFIMVHFCKIFDWVIFGPFKLIFKNISDHTDVRVGS
jgi:hypothetical protein